MTHLHRIAPLAVVVAGAMAAKLATATLAAIALYFLLRPRRTWVV